MKVVFYSTSCAKCNILGQKLEDKNIEYELCSDVDLMISKGILSAPALEVDGEIMTFKKAVDWVNALEVTA